MATPARIFMADDHQLVIDGVAGMIVQCEELELVGTASTGPEALQSIAALQPDLVLLDVNLPGLNGIEIARQLLADHPEIRIAILSMHGEKAIVQRLLEMGVAGYFLKTVDHAELRQGLLQILRGKPYFHAEAMSGFVRRSTHLETASEQLLLLQSLSAREKEVLEHIAMGLTSREIAQKLHLSERTVETHRKNIHSKLGIKNLAGLIRFAVKAGLVT